MKKVIRQPAFCQTPSYVRKSINLIKEEEPIFERTKERSKTVKPHRPRAFTT
jgi:hypothetical protein